MNLRLSRKLCKRFPKIFRLPEDTSRLRTPYELFGISVGNGWFKLLWSLCLAIEKEGVHEDFQVMQIKEKFAGLRFYVSSTTTEIFKLIDEAETKSLKTCEVCGRYGRVRYGGWIVTLCGFHSSYKRLFNIIRNFRCKIFSSIKKVIGKKLSNSLREIFLRRR